ncbi:MAG: NAD(P)-dependent alcohol dehydrogenase [Myxococcota bacterium]
MKMLHERSDMRAIVYDRYGPPEVLQVRAVPAPTPSRGTSRVRVEAVGLNPKDVLVRKGRMRWLVGGGLPRIPGYDVAGELIDPAPGLPAGASVFGMLQRHRGGACAELAVLRHDELAPRPASLDALQAASLPLAGLTALQALRDELAVQPGQQVLLNGASGGVGTLAVQITRALGAQPIAVCSGRNAELVRGLGAHEVIDYTHEDLTARRGLDAVFDIYGNLGWARARTMLRRDGRFCTTVPRPASIARGVLRRLGVHRAALVVVRSRRADLEQLAAWVEAGRLRPVVDRVVGFADSAAGHRHLETRRARGKVVVDVRA